MKRENTNTDSFFNKNENNKNYMIVEGRKLRWMYMSRKGIEEILLNAIDFLLISKQISLLIIKIEWDENELPGLRFLDQVKNLD